MIKEFRDGKIYLGDSAKILESLPENSIDLTVTSPPYDKLRTYKGFTLNFEAIAEQLYRVTKQGGIVVWIVNDSTVNGSETGTSFRQALYFKELGFNLHDTMIYEKSGCAMPSPSRYLASFEFMFVLSKGKPATYNLIEDRKNRFPERWGKGRKVRNKDGTWSYRENYIAKEYGRRFNVWRYQGGYGYGQTDDLAYKHPAIFPEKLAQDHIISWSNEGDTILDPFFGSGTTGKMAILNKRKFIGIEISEEYFDLASQRINLCYAEALSATK